MAVPKRKRLVLWILCVLNVCSFMFFTGICGDVPDDVVYTELHKDVRIGTKAVLTCRFRGSPLAVYWKKGYDPRNAINLVSWIPTDNVTGRCEGQRVCDVMELNKNHSLIIREVGFAERGRYICRVANYKGNVIHNFTDVSLYAPPKEPYPVIDGCFKNMSSASNPESCSVLANRTINLTCSVTNYYPDIELFFLHGTKQMTTINQVEQTNIDSTKNRLISIEADASETLYTCVASDVPGSRERKAASILVMLVESSIFIPSETIPGTVETVKEKSPGAIRAVKIVIPIVLLGIAAVVFLCWIWKRRHNHSHGTQGSPRVDADMSKVDSSERSPMIPKSEIDGVNRCITHSPDLAATPEVAEQSEFSDIIKKLDLGKYYPSKISLMDAMLIKNPAEYLKLPWKFIHKVLMTDFHARGHLLSDVNKSSSEERRDEGGVFDLEALLEMQNTSVGSENNETMNLNPLDVMVAIFTCCDNFLKQTLAQKLFICKLAIPFLYPLGSEGKVGMSLWALRTITVQRQTEKKCISKSSVTDKYFPVVTFVRLGRAPLSKSKLINDILRDDGHDTFFHKDCLNGTVTRRITNGLVECFWFITLDGQKDHLPETTIILNLRGDASVMKKQMQILQEISSVIFVSATDQELATPQNTNTFQQILQTNAKVILLLICGKYEQGTRACFEKIGKDFMKAVSIILSRTKDGIKKNASVLRTEAREKLSEAISGCSGAVLEECAQRAREMGIIIDEYDDEACLEGKVLADNVVSNVKDINIADCKNLLLPLQGPYWIEYCNMLKRLHRTTSTGQGTHSSLHHADELKQKMKLLREKQVEICKNGLTPFIKDFMSTLQKDGDVMYFLRWIDLYLNERQLASASFGMENLFRELGQIYEAMKESGKEGQETGIDVEYLPEIAAKLLVKGIPLELVDGDSSNIPIVWVSAVLRQLGNIIGQKRLFVLSILGIQSSGKSTLLNTMFGLQFAVSAGGCTKGAYMQLIPVDKYADLPFDYVVVVDTEGLRAPGLGQLKYEPDNKLATLVFGLGNVNMIHIKRELSEEMADVLQIVVHAFLRMNLARKHTQDDKTCIFLHQNTPEANAVEMRHGCLKVQDVLNDRTKEAALCENLKNIYLFSQIVNFDVQKHVWFFPDLWHGNQIKARADPAYCEKVAALRSNVLGEIAKGQKSFLTSSDLSVHLADLWNRILDDDFVFRFRNSLEVKSYNSKQSEYYTLEMN